MVKLSVVIITLNEEKNIERCLASVQEIADDIVILDSFSTDKTEEICKKYNARFIQHKFDGHIQQKNRVITMAQFPHVLSLDADEEVSPELKKSILKIKENWEKDGYYFNRLNNYCGKWIYHTNWYPDKKLRLWDSRKGSWGGENPHDKFILNNGATHGYISGDLFHYSFKTIEEHILQMNKFSSIAASEKFKKGKRAGFFDLTFRPCWEFLKGYVVKYGFLDGYYGFIICKINAQGTFLKYAKLIHLNKQAKKQ